LRRFGVGGAFAWAQPACSPSSCNLQVQLSGFDPNTVLTVTLHSDPIALGTVATDADGVAALEAVVPAGVTGEHTVVVSGTSPSGVSQRGTFPVDVTPVDLPDHAALTPLVPARLLDSRAGATTVDGAQAGEGRRSAGSVTEVVVAGRGGVPASASAVVLNVTAVSPDAAGYLTVYPCGSPVPVASNLNFNAGETRANQVTVDLGTGGKACFSTNTPAHVIADLTGYLS
jgi:hypothetical protein